jgi:hypothetical protein
MASFKEFDRSVISKLFPKFANIKFYIHKDELFSPVGLFTSYRQLKLTDDVCVDINDVKYFRCANSDNLNVETYWTDEISLFKTFMKTAQVLFTNHMELTKTATNLKTVETGLVDLKQKCQDLTTMNKKLETDLADLKTKNKKLEDDIRRLRIIMIKYRTEMESIYIESKKRKASN